jgi:hypothetical protein
LKGMADVGSFDDLATCPAVGPLDGSVATRQRQTEGAGHHDGPCGLGDMVRERGNGRATK